MKVVEQMRLGLIVVATATHGTRAFIKDNEKIKNNSDITAIGHITDEDYGAKLITKSNNAHSIKAQGWESFKG